MKSLLFIVDEGLDIQEVLHPPPHSLTLLGAFSHYDTPMMNWPLESHL